MKNIPAAIAVLFMILILAGLFVFMCLPTGIESANASKGICELQNEKMEGRLYSLRGEWLFYHDKLLTPGDFKEHTETIKVPSDWVSAGHSVSGVATYRLTIQTDSTKPLMLYIPEISSAYALWINGRFVRKSGTVSNKAENGRPLYENALVPVSPENGIIELTVQVSNYHYFLGGMTSSPLLGDAYTVLSWFFRTRLLYCIALGCILMAAFYHLAFFIFQPEEKAYLILSILCGLCFLRFLLETDGINQFLQWIPMDVIGIRVFLVLYFLHCAVVFLFAIYVFNRDFLTSRKYISAIYIIIGALLFTFMPLSTTVTLPVFTLTILLFGLFTVFMTANSSVFRNNRWSWLYFSSLLIYVVMGSAVKLVFENILFMSGLLTNIFMIMAQSLVLSKNYAGAFETVKHTNENLERIVNDRTMDLENTNNAMKELVGNISHDLKTPLAVMRVSLEKLLEMTSVSANHLRYVQIAYNKNLDLQRLIQNLIEVSRIETGKSLYKPEWSSLNGLLAQMPEKYEGYLESVGLYLDVSSSINSTDELIYIDPIKIWSVFDNIIYNAVRYTQIGGITITAKMRDNAVTIIVTDTGCGIAPEYLPHIFERFYKVSLGCRGSDGDSGVGLYVVRSIMERFGGHVEAESRVGEGLSIILTFMRKKE